MHITRLLGFARYIRALMLLVGLASLRLTAQEYVTVLETFVVNSGGTGPVYQITLWSDYSLTTQVVASGSNGGGSGTSASTGGGGTGGGGPSASAAGKFIGTTAGHIIVKISTYNGIDKGFKYEIAVPSGATGFYVQAISICFTYRQGPSFLAGLTELIPVNQGEFQGRLTPAFTQLEDINRVINPVGMTNENGDPLIGVSIMITSAFVPGSTSLPSGFSNVNSLVLTNGTDSVTINPQEFYSKPSYDVGIMGNNFTVSRGFNVTVGVTDPQFPYLACGSCN